MKKAGSKVAISDLGEISFLSSPQYNPTGKLLAFVKSQADVAENEYVSCIYLYDPKTGKTRKLTSGGSETAFSWLDEATILFTGRKDKKDGKRTREVFTPVLTIPVDGGEAEKLFEIPAAVDKLWPLGKGGFLFTHKVTQGETPLYQLKDTDRAAEILKREEAKDYHVLEEIPFWSNGAGFTSGQRTKLCHYSVKSGKVTELTGDSFDVSEVTLDEDKSRALIIGREAKAKLELPNDVLLLQIKSKKTRKLETGHTETQSAQFMEGNQIFLLINEARQFGLNENASFFLYELESGELTKMVPDQDISVGSSVNSDMRFGEGESVKVSGGWIYYIETNDTDALLKRMDLAGKTEVIVDDEGSVDDFAVDTKGNLACVIMKPDSLQELYTVTNSREKRISRFNEAYLKSRLISKSEALRCQGEGDDIIKGFVLKPVNYKKGTKYPGILAIHGGPKTVYGNVFIHEMQVWASRGFFVFFCNPKGSDGKGNDFADIRGRYGTVDYANLMDFTDKVLDTYPDIDVKRLCVTGGSYGGYMTNWIIGHNPQFKAAASQRSISSWLSFFGTSDIGYYFTPDQTTHTPWTDHLALWDQSPLKYADKVVTPTLFLHSDEDYRCWSPEAYQMFTALKYHGVDSKLCLFHGENHELSRSGKPKQRIRRLTEITEWFETYTK